MSRTWKLYVVFACSTLAGCARHEYFPIGNGYGYRMSVSGIPDGGKRVTYSYTRENGRRGTLWPKLFSGYYGPDIVQDDIILFAVDLDAHGASHLSNVLAARGGPPVVDITKAVITSVNKTRGDVRSIDFGRCTFKRTASGVSIELPQWVDERSTFDSVEAHLSWQEIEELIRRIRASGTQHRFKGITYYGEN